MDHGQQRAELPEHISAKRRIHYQNAHVGKRDDAVSRAGRMLP